MRSFTTRSCIAPVLIALGASSPALAEPAKVVLLPYQPIGRQASPELAGQITRTLTDELGEMEVITLIQPGEAEEVAPAEEAAPAPKANDEGARKALDKALKYAEAGNKALKKHRFEPAIKALSEALKLFPESAAALTDVTPVAQAHLDIAVAFWKRGREDDAIAHMDDAARLAPDMKLDPKEYFPLFLNVYDKEWRKTLRQPRGKVRVDATVAGTEVFLDGKSVGAAPILMTNIVPGRHYLRVVKDGAGVFGAPLMVEGEQTLEITADLGGGEKSDASLGPVAAALDNNLINDEAVQAAAGIGRKAGAAYVIFGGVQKAEATIAVYSYIVKVGEADAVAAELPQLELDLDLLSASVESFKLVEDVAARVKDFGETLPPGASPIVRGLDSGEGGDGVTEVDVGPPVPDSRKAPTTSSRVAPAEGVDGGDEGGEDDSRVAVIGGDEQRKPRASLSGGTSTTRPVDPYEPKKPIYMQLLSSPPLLAGVVIGGVVVGAVLLSVTGAAAAGGGLAGWYLLSPPQRASVEATW